MHNSHIFFDLDGTLTDSAPGILNSLAHAFDRLGLPVPERRALYPFIGPPLLESFQRRCGLSEAQAQRAVAYYREYFAARGLFENAVYPGIPEALSALRAAGKRLVIATGKPEEYALRIAERFGLSEYFDCVCGARMDETRTAKDEVIRYALTRAGVREPGNALMVGDRENDVRGARICGMECVGVLYGYGGREELTAAGALALAETPAALPELILGLCPAPAAGS